MNRATKAVTGFVAAVVTMLCGLLLGVAIIAAAQPSTAIAAAGCGNSSSGTGRIVRGDQDSEATNIARTIVGVVQQRRLPRRAAVIAITTGLVESHLHNLDHGDRDSLGVFQQRPSQGWGSRAEILNPAHATNTFLDRLLALPGWDTLPPGKAEQAVQNSGFPGRYAPREPEAAQIVASIWTGPDNPVPHTTAETSASTCGDDGKSDVPLPPGSDQKTRMPAGFTLPADPRQKAAVGYAVAQLGKRYVWGGKGPDAFDCSGLMLAAWATAGIGIPASTVGQVKAGHAVPDQSQLQPGDLLFIPGALGTPAQPRHVGMYVGAGLIVDAYDEEHGVVVERLADWSARIVAIRRIADPTSPSPPPGGSQPR
ncbi:C40 family peptidase [Amycolatopsis rubida]|uniref:C40 family peptidase n=1 Tax=Amycolatopsis rubida TaxID=112413 RepID=A0ABX0C8L9_9PSEU|nr:MULTISPECIES: C40 family peptidase [Amycolatopsis]MYW96282.1 NlpC/P60 family protein [Amycolatopsis rubida]NEC61273.1 C40 family peptidase [Amycolatopsis rubida]OAP24195.1 putative endopeptidase p60 precursor [Amycolatopsis sp. M39]